MWLKRLVLFLSTAKIHVSLACEIRWQNIVACDCNAIAPASICAQWHGSFDLCMEILHKHSRSSHRMLLIGISPTPAVFAAVGTSRQLQFARDLRLHVDENRKSLNFS